MTKLANYSKSEKFNIALKLSLTDKGINFFLKHKKKAERIRLSDNELVYGIICSSISQEYLHKLIRHGFISRLETGRSEYGSVKDEITALTKLIVNETVFHKINTNILSNIMSSTFIMNWNRSNPGKTFDKKTAYNIPFLKKYISENHLKKRNIIKYLMNEILNDINKDNMISVKEKNILLSTAESIINNIGNIAWFIMIQTSASYEFNYIIKTISLIITDYINKLKTGDYLALLIIELLSNAEHAKLNKILKQFYRNDNADISLINKKIREQIYRNLEDKKDYISVSWKICSREGVSESDGRLKISILNKEYNYKDIKSEFDEKLKINLKNKNLFDFYNEEENRDLKSDLGFYYLTYMNDACRQSNIKFDSYISKISGDDFPIITMSLNFK